MPRGGYLSLYLSFFLGYILGTEGLGAQTQECAITGILRNKLQYKYRLQYMKHYFPIDYRISVPYEGVLRLANITRLQQTEVNQSNLRYLWASLNCKTMDIIQSVLWKDHPSWNYIKEIYENLIRVRDIEMDLQLDPQVETILRRANPGRDWKMVKPKALLDNCYKVMNLLYCLCCKENVQNWEDCVVPQTQPHSHHPPPQCAGPAALLYLPSQAQTSLVGGGELRPPQVEADRSGKATLGEERFIP